LHGIISKTKKPERIIQNYDICNLNRKQWIQFVAICAPILYVVGLLFYDNFALAGGLVIAIIPLSHIYSRSLAKKRRDTLMTQFCELLQALVVSFQIGRQMSDALEESYATLDTLYNGDEPIMVELQMILDQKKRAGVSEKESLYDLARRSKLADISDFVDVYYTSLEVGGDVCKLAARSASVISDKISIKRDIALMNSQRKYESMILLVIPAIILIFLKLSSPDYLDKLYNNPLGILIMTISLIIIYISYRLSEKILDIEV
jgi:tight adherence protein B